MIFLSGFGEEFSLIDLASSQPPPSPGGWGQPSASAQPSSSSAGPGGRGHPSASPQPPSSTAAALARSLGLRTTDVVSSPTPPSPSSARVLRSYPVTLQLRPADPPQAPSAPSFPPCPCRCHEQGILCATCLSLLSPFNFCPLTLIYHEMFQL